jgi:hypothetical protein
MAKSSRTVTLTPNESAKHRTTRDNAAALAVPGYGSEGANHYLTIDDPPPRPLPEPSKPAPVRAARKAAKASPAKAAKTAAKRAPAPRKAATAAAVEAPTSIVARLRSASTRDEARAIVTGMKVKDLKAIADAAEIAYGSRYTKPKLIDEIVHWTVGRRLTSDAISRPGPTAISPNG